MREEGSDICGLDSPAVRRSTTMRVRTACAFVLVCLVSGCNLDFATIALANVDGVSPPDAQDDAGDAIVSSDPVACEGGTCPSGCTVAWTAVPTRPGASLPVAFSLSDLGPDNPAQMTGAAVLYPISAVNQVGRVEAYYEDAARPLSLLGPTVQSASIVGLGGTALAAQNLMPVVTGDGVWGLDLWGMLVSGPVKSPVELSQVPPVPDTRIAVTSPLDGQSFVGWVDTSLWGARVRAGSSPSIERIFDGPAVNAGGVVGSFLDSTGEIRVFVCAEAGTSCASAAYRNDSSGGVLAPVGTLDTHIAVRPILRMTDNYIHEMAVTSDGSSVYLTPRVFDGGSGEVAVARLAAARHVEFVFATSPSAGPVFDLYVLGEKLVVARASAQQSPRLLASPEVLEPTPGARVIHASVAKVDERRTLIAVQDANGLNYLGERLCPGR